MRHMISVRRLSLLVLAAALLGSACGAAPETPPPAAPVAASKGSGAVTPAIQSVLDGIRAADTGMLAVSEEDGRFLRLLVAARSAKSILEIGGASGYSGIWLGLGARETGGQVVSIEYDPARAREGAANIAKAGLGDVVRNIEGDAFVEIPKLSRSFDLVFLDAWKPDYLEFFEMVYPSLAPGGLFVAHNVVNKKDDMQPFLAAINGHTGLFTTIVSPSGEGMSVSYKTR
jgi:predicted O-methyltransferase YrrM